VGNVSLGGATRAVSATIPAFSLSGVQDGSHDLVAYRFAGSSQLADDRVLIRRDLNVTSGGSLAAIDFASAEAVSPVFATVAAQGSVVGEQVSHVMAYLTGAACVAAPFYSTVVSTETTTAFGVPASLQRPTDFHQYTVTAGGATSSRVVQESFRTLAPRAFVLGRSLSSVAMSASVGPYKRLTVSAIIPDEYQSMATFSYGQGSGAGARTAVITATSAWQGGTSATFAIPDFAGVAGWNDTWAPANGVLGSWQLHAIGVNLPGSLCTEGRRMISASQAGTF
jgi:hypothetical protein